MARLDYVQCSPSHNSGRFGDIYLQRSGLTSNYNAGIVKFQHKCLTDCRF